MQSGLIKTRHKNLKIASKIPATELGTLERNITLWFSETLICHQNIITIYSNPYLFFSQNSSKRMRGLALEKREKENDRDILFPATHHFLRNPKREIFFCLSQSGMDGDGTSNWKGGCGCGD